MRYRLNWRGLGEDGDSRGGEKRSRSGFILKVDPTEFADTEYVIGDKERRL